MSVLYLGYKATQCASSHRNAKVDRDFKFEVKFFVYNPSMYTVYHQIELLIGIINKKKYHK